MFVDVDLTMRSILISESEVEINHTAPPTSGDINRLSVIKLAEGSFVY